MSLLPAAARGQTGKELEGKGGVAQNWTLNADYANHVTTEAVSAEIERIYAMGPRAVGQSGHAKIKEYVRAEVRRLSERSNGYLQWKEQPFFATVPVDVRKDEAGNIVDGNAELTIGGEMLRPLAMYPNLVAPSVVGGAGVTAELVDGGDGSFGSLNGKTVKNSIVVLDFNGDKQWENAAKLGAAAILFRHPDKTSQAQASKKFFLVPLEMPRYLLSPEDTARVNGLLAQGRGVKATLKGGARWEKVPASNILALLPGTDADPVKAKNLLVIQVYVDSMCIAPGAPHGADTSLQLIAGLNILRGMMADETTRPKCSVLIAFTDAHHEALQGARSLAYLFWTGRENKLPELQKTAENGATAASNVRVALGIVEGEAGTANAEVDAILAEQVEAIVSRRSVRTARYLHEVRNAAQVNAEDLTYLVGVRNWYGQLKTRVGGVEKVKFVRGGAMKWDDQRYLDARLSTEVIAEALRSRLFDLDRDAMLAEADATVAKWLLEGRKDARTQGLYIELVPEADQLSWAGVTNYGMGSSAQSLFPNMHASHLPVANAMGRALGIRQKNPLDDAFSIEGTTQRGNFLSPQVSEGNALVMAGVPAFGLVSINAARPYLDTPVDVPQTVDKAKAADTMKFLNVFVSWIANDLSLLTLNQMSNAKPTNLVGRAVEYDVLAGLFPNEPVPGALVYYPLQWLNEPKEVNRTIAGVRFAMVDQVDRSGRYEMRMIPGKGQKYAKKDTNLYGFRVNERGEVDYALDYSANGVEVMSNAVYRSSPFGEVSVAIAKMRGVALYDMVDPRTMAPLNELRVLQAKNLGRPDAWSIYLPIDNVCKDDSVSMGVDTCGIAYGPSGVSVVALASAGFAGVRAAYMNTDSTVSATGEPICQGFELGAARQVDFTSLKVATDMVRVNEGRLQIMEKQGIRDKLLTELVRESRVSLDNATASFAAQNYSNAYREATHAWGVALRAYTPVKNQGKDAVIGSVFLMALCLPFAFFCERLTIRAKNPNWRILGTLAWFAAVFVLLLYIHPAFKISLNPMIVLLAFVMLVLVLVVTSIIYRKFVLLIRQYRNQLEGSHAADFKRFSAGGVALNLSLSTMARRLARTTLTGATITMLSFAIVTFSSISTGISYKQTPILGVTPAYTGLLLRLPGWADMPRSIAVSFANEFGERNLVLPRMWKLRSQDPWALGVSGNTTMLIQRGMDEGADRAETTDIRGAVGMTPGEAELLDMKRVVIAGTWLRPGHDEDMLLSPEVAEQLGVRPEDLGTPRAEVSILQQSMTVVGIMDPAVLEKWTDLDGEGIAPADYAAAGIVGTGANSSDLVNIPTFDLSVHMPHLPFNRVVITTVAKTEAMQGVYKSVSVKFGPGVDAKRELERLMRRLTTPMFAGVVRQAPEVSAAGLYESQDKPDLKGYGKLVVPILLAVFMIVNTLLGTVEERKDEIGMLNSVGLAPAHVGMLFLVEAIVYGVIGLVVGYLFGLVLAKLLLGNAAFMTAIGAAGVSLNYSSGSTIISCALVLVIVVASAIYPAQQAKKMASPGSKGRWSLPKSESGEISVEVPFTLTGGNALGMLGFLDEYLAQHTDATSPDFRVIRKELVERAAADGVEELVLAGDSYLAPYDLGVSNGFSIQMRQAEDPNILRVKFVIQRRGGDMTSYRRATQKFLDLLRRQFLIWRTLELVEKQKYVERAKAGFAADLAGAEGA